MASSPDTPAPIPLANASAAAFSAGENEPTVLSGRTPGKASGSTLSADIGRHLQGTMLGPYRLDTFIGGGGMGAVFRALDTTLDRIVAVKVLAGRQADDEELLRRFRNEAQSAARLDHENIGRVHAVGSEAGWHYIVFEYIEGRNLRDLVRDEGPFDVPRTVDVALQVADALEHASQREVVHRDIKPSNIVITPTGRARIVDMGLARLHHVTGDRDLTVSGMTLGTFDYISPEQARDPRAADVRSDLYSLGCTIFFMLAGRPPFADGTMVQKLLQHQQEPPPDLESLRPDVPRRLAAIVNRLMAKDPHDRYQRPAALVADLLAFADEQGIGLVTPRPAIAAVPVEPRRPQASRLPWIVPLTGLAALVGWLWLSGAAARRQLGDRPGPQPAPARVEPARVLQIGEQAGQGADAGGELGMRVAEAIRAAKEGDVIELSFSGSVDLPPLALADRTVVLRAAAGSRPGLRFLATTPVDDETAAACTVGAGRLELRGVAMSLAPQADGGPRPALFAIGSGTLVCEDALLEMPGEPTGDGGPSPAPAAFLAVDFGDTARDGECRVSLVRTWAYGDAVFLGASRGGPGRIILEWSGGGLASPRHLLEVDGVDGSVADRELVVEGTFENALFACRDTLVSLRDSAFRPGLPRLRATVRDCRFLSGGGPLIDQSGVAAPAAYEAAVTWRNLGSRYEGGDIFRRIAAAAERTDQSYRDQPTPFLHTPRVEAWPDPAAWNDDWWGAAD